MQFFQHLGQWLTLDQIKKVREKEKKEREWFCPYCVSKSMRHMKDCPTRKEDFDPNTPPLTEEQREELLKLKELNS